MKGDFDLCHIASISNLHTCTHSHEDLQACEEAFIFLFMDIYLSLFKKKEVIFQFLELKFYFPIWFDFLLDFLNVHIYIYI